MITVIGGTYREIDYDEIIIEIFGSGFRGSKFLLENKCNVDFHTTGNQETLLFLKENQKVYKNLTYHCQECNGKLPEKEYGLFVDKKFINLNCKT